MSKPIKAWMQKLATIHAMNEAATKNLDAKAILEFFGITYKEEEDEKTEKTTPDKSYSVQVGAYKEKKNAEDMKRKLKKAGFDGVIKEV